MEVTKRAAEAPQHRGQYLLPTPAWGRSSDPTLAHGPCHPQGLAVSGLWSSALEPVTPTSTPAQHHKPLAQLEPGRRQTPDSSRGRGLYGRGQQLTGHSPRTQVSSVPHKVTFQAVLPSHPGVMTRVAMPGPAMGLAPVGNPWDEEDTWSTVSRAPCFGGWGEVGRPACNLKAPEVTGSAIGRGRGGHQHCPRTSKGELDSAPWPWSEELPGALATKS